MNFIVIIPARFSSKRLPGKPLININGKPMVVRVMEQAQASGADRVIVATDHFDVVKAIKQAKGEVCLTRLECQSGIERIQEVINKYDFPDDQAIVNVQGDEPFISPKIINQVAENLLKVDTEMATLAVPISTLEEAHNPNVVKVVLNLNGYALYFSRTLIPWNQINVHPGSEYLKNNLLRHIGIYSYYTDFINRYVSWKASPLEKVEDLEQLRVLWYGERIYVSLAKETPGISVNTPEELVKVRSL